MLIQVLGIDLGKSNFHIIGHDRAGKTVVRKKHSRNQLNVFLQQLPPTTIAFEACGGAHWLGRLCQQLAHQVKLIPPQYVKPYVKGNKNDFIDADAIAEAAARPSMRFVAVKTEAAQMMSAVHRVRQGYIKERTACMSRIGALLCQSAKRPQCHEALIHGARAILARPEKTGAVFGEWLIKLRATKPFNVACVALANKLARLCGQC